MSKRLTILMAPLDIVGPINAFIAIGEVLRDRGHRIVFAVSHQWRGKLSIYGFEEEIFGLKDRNESKDPAKQGAELCLRSGLFGPRSPMEKLKSCVIIAWNDTITNAEASDPLMEEIVIRIKPDIILIDNFVGIPSLVNSGIPWINSLSCNPLCIDFMMDCEKIPPSCLGLPTNGDKKEWQKLRNEKNDALSGNWNKYNDWVMSKGLPSLPKYKMITPSPYLNIYMFPKELDYVDLIGWHQFDCFKRSGILDTFEIPEKLRNSSGKLIYFSMGSMGGFDVDLMKKLVSILSKCEHRFIVSKGPLSEQYQLADNMWGEKSVPQIKVLPIVDLVITHGGNNTITEAFYFGKPIIVMPLFFDQYDNAQRLHETGFGLRLDQYNCEETELLESIDRLLSDEKLALKLKKVSERIQNSNSVIKVAELIEGLVK